MFTTSVHSMEKNTNGDVLRVWYQRNYTRDDGEWAAIELMALDAPDPDNYVAYDDLTADLVLSWCDLDFTSTDEALQYLADRDLGIISQVEFNDFPWHTVDDSGM